MTTLSFTSTACCRPDVFERTLSSFRENLQGVDLKNLTLHLNIDPVPNPRDAVEVIRIATMFFDYVNVNQPATPSFPAAVKWCWSQPMSDYFFHLEDDWELTQPVHFDDLMALMNHNPDLSCVNLRAYDWDEADSRICLSPGLHRTDHAQTMAARMTTTANPEKQLRPVAANNLQGGRHLGFFGTCYPKSRVLKDIGREWLDGSGWRKTVPIHFTHWERK